MIRLAFLLVFFAIVQTQAAEMVLPRVIYAVPDVPVSVVFRNTALIAPETTVSFSFECNIGQVIDDEKWTLTATEDQVGDHVLKLKSDGSEVVTTIRVVPKSEAANRKVALIIVGESLTNASKYPNQIFRLFSGEDNPELKMLGTHHPKSAAENVFHEGYGGWTWNWFNTRWEPGEVQVEKLRNSPFLILKDGEPTLDLHEYFEKYCDGKTPDFVTFLLGINDCFHAAPDNPEAITAKIDSMISEAETLLAAFRKASPETEIGICLTPAGNDRDGAFYANYKDRYTRWGWRRIQFELVKRQLEHFGNREAENIFIVPISVGIDPMAGYLHDNGVRPTEAGYNELGAEIFGWLKWRLAEKS
ncbi:MAG: SGNH/GDSL hydrolase family protein [Verrucomicrobiales bacterium]